MGMQTLVVAGLPGANAAYEAKEYATALKELTPLAQEGDAKARYKLGTMYAEGKGVPKDDSLASSWYRKAAEHGLSYAQNIMGLAYDIGRGVPKNDSFAQDWYRVAAEQGLKEAQSNLALMYQEGQGVPKNEKLAAP